MFKITTNTIDRITFKFNKLRLMSVESLQNIAKVQEVTDRTVLAHKIIEAQYGRRVLEIWMIS